MDVIYRKHEKASAWFRNGHRIFFSIAVLVLSWLIFLGCSGTSGEKEDLQAERKISLHVSSDPESFARHIVGLLAAKQIKELASYVHPAKGVRLSPYGFVDKEKDIVLLQNELISAWSADTSFTWGFYDGSGEPITIPIQLYFSEFIYNAEFLSAPRIAVNQIIGKGNSINNIAEVYPDAIFAEFHFPGFDQKYEGMDWLSLRLVLESKADGGWWLVGIIHDQWTI